MRPQGVDCSGIEGEGPPRALGLRLLRDLTLPYSTRVWRMWTTGSRSTSDQRKAKRLLAEAVVKAEACGTSAG
jgi:hypothetical protein